MSAQPLPAPEAPRRRTPAKSPAKAAPAKAAPAKAAPVKAALRGRLSLVPTPARARRAPFVVLLLVLLASALIGLLLLNTASAQDSFRLHALQDEDAVLQQQINALTGMADGLDDPATLAKKAAALGMVPGGAPVFLKRGQPLPKGAIRIGNLVYVPGAVPVPPPTPPPTPAAKVTTPAAKKPAVKKPVVKRTPVVPHKAVVTKAPVTAVKPTTAAGTTGTARTPVTTATKAPVAARTTAPTTAARTAAKPTTATGTTPVGGH
jgi:hypothetical protein